MKLEIDPVENHRSREAGAIVYPVYSRRSGGLSVGINLFPEKKLCNFDCPYCEVFGFNNPSARFKTAAMEEALVSALETARKNGVTVKDICFSGNGEPSMSPDFRDALEKTFYIKERFVPGADIVLITNGTGLLDAGTFDLLAEKALAGLRIWLKIDAAALSWFTKINRPRSSAIDFSSLLDCARAFAEKAPFIIQTMLCKVEGEAPPEEEESAWVKLAAELAAPGNLRCVQIYGKARPSPEDPLAEALDVSFLERRAHLLTKALEASRLSVPVKVFP